MNYFLNVKGFTEPRNGIISQRWGYFAKEYDGLCKM